MIRQTAVLFFLLLMQTGLMAQNTASWAPDETEGPIAQSTGFSGTGSNIDVQYHRIY